MSDLITEHTKTEEQFINILLNNKTAVKKWLSSTISVKHFEPIHEHVLRAIAWANGEGVALTRQSFNNFLEMRLKTPAEVAGNMNIFNRITILYTKPDDFPMLLVKIKHNYVQRRSAEILAEYRKEKEGGIEQANDLMAKKLMALSRDFEDSMTAYIDLASYQEKFMEDLLARRANPATRLVCNIPEIDETMAVGFKNGALTIFCAAPGTFKTTIMMNVALNIFKNSGENVMYIPLEGGADMFLQKIVSRETEIPSIKIEHAHLLTEQEVKKVAAEFDKWKSLSHKFKILKPGDRCKVSTIRHEIESRLAYYCPRIVVVDYLDNVVSDGKHGSRDDLDIRDKLEELIRMGDNFGFHVVTAAKLSREAIKRLRDVKDGKQELDTADVHGGQEFGGQATNLYGQMRNVNQPGSKLDFFCMKARFGSPIFKNGRVRASLDIKPEIGLVESEMAKEVTWNYDGSKDAAAILNDASIVAPPVTDSLPADEDSPF